MVYPRKQFPPKKKAIDDSDEDIIMGNTKEYGENKQTELDRRHRPTVGAAKPGSRHVHHCPYKDGYKTHVLRKSCFGKHAAYCPNCYHVKDIRRNCNMCGASRNDLVIDAGDLNFVHEKPQDDKPQDDLRKRAVAGNRKNKTKVTGNKKGRNQKMRDRNSGATSGAKNDKGSNANKW